MNMLCYTEQCDLLLLSVHRDGMKLYTNCDSDFQKSKHSLLMSGFWRVVFATVIYVPGIVCVCYSTVDNGKSSMTSMCMD
jgi:hypothetical protein